MDSKLEPCGPDGWTVESVSRSIPTVVVIHRGVKVAAMLLTPGPANLAAFYAITPCCLALVLTPRSNDGGMHRCFNCEDGVYPNLDDAAIGPTRFDLGSGLAIFMASFMRHFTDPLTAVFLGSEIAGCFEAEAAFAASDD